MPSPIDIPFELKTLLNKALLFVGIVIIVYALLLILAKLNIIPAIIYSIFPQIVLLLIGIFLVYFALSKRKNY